MRQAGDYTACERIAHGHENDGNGARGPLRCQGSRWCQGNNEINRNLHELERHFRQLVERTFRPSKFKTDILALDVAKFLQALTYRLEL
ncbi:MAG TPA: hypothetical protein VEH02_10095 [Pseudolabrys sp.]|nr:hypothetical protein [Pseudolabrys sp.]